MSNKKNNEVLSDSVVLNLWGENIGFEEDSVYSAAEAWEKELLKDPSDAFQERRKPSEDKIAKLAKEIKELTPEYTSLKKSYDERSDQYNKAMDRLEELVGQEKELQKEWNWEEAYLPIDEGGWKLFRPSSWLNYETWINYYPEGHILHSEGTLYKEFEKNRQEQRELEEEWVRTEMPGYQSQNVFGHTVYTGPTGRSKKEMLLESLDDVKDPLARKQYEYMLSTGEYHEGITPELKRYAESIIGDKDYPKKYQVNRNPNATR